MDPERSADGAVVDVAVETVGVLREAVPGERRVALVPTSVPALAKAGLTVVIERGAGEAAGFVDEAYVEKGASLAGRDEVLRADVLVQVRTFGARSNDRADLAALRPGRVVIGLASPLWAPRNAAAVARAKVTLFALELLPRITRAQGMDVLSSQATVAGYRAVLEAAGRLPKMFPLMTTAAGTIPPARVLVIGAGVAGLQAIATARRLGAVVEAYDVRPAAKEQVESLGARFVELPLQPGDAEDASGYAKALGEGFYRRQRELLGRVVAGSDVVVTTALIPGQPAPVLVTAEMVAAMAPGSVVVDIAAEQGGNCELTRADETVVEHGVTILGPTNLPATVARDASLMYSKNASSFLLHLVSEGRVRVLPDDEIGTKTLVAHGGRVVHPKVRELLATLSDGEKVA
jgi:proton-translocating NAD(P)+ transhydrogenase subunit alpha